MRPFEKNSGNIGSAGGKAQVVQQNFLCRSKYFIWLLLFCGIASVMLLFNEASSLSKFLMQYRLIHIEEPNCSVANEKFRVLSSELGRIFDGGKIQFLENYKNPCWYERIRDKNSQSKEGSECPIRLRCLPYFMIIGQPKSASSDLFARICRHPQIRRGKNKGLHWWSRKRYENLPFSKYVKFFDQAAKAIQEITVSSNGSFKHNVVTGEASTSLFWDTNYIRKPSYDSKSKLIIQKNAADIKSLLPDIKLIVILRDPVERLYSDYHFFNNDKAKSPEEFHEFASNAVMTFNNCSKYFMDSYCAHNRKIKRKSKVRLQVGVYSVFLKEWLLVFPKKQILVVNFEKYASNIKYYLAKVFEFLQLRELNYGEESEIASETPQNVNHNAARKKSMFPETRHLLENFYARFNKELAELLNDDSFLWGYPGNYENVMDT